MRRNLHSTEIGGFFLKKFETLDQQLAILHERGLTITNYKREKQFLLTNNYYNIINGYSKYFVDSNTNRYIVGATFSEITQLYSFDKELKFAFFKAITEAEKHIKSILAYRFAEYYPDKPYAYLDINSYDNSKVLDLGWLISQLSRTINNQKKLRNSNPIKHYVDQHNDVPIWVLINYLDFGEMSTLLKNLPIQLQNKVAQNMCSFISEQVEITMPFTPEIMNSFIKNIREVRNTCAHNNRLLDFKCKSSSKYYFDLHQKFNIARNTEKNDVYNVFLSLKCFLSKTQYAQLHNTIRKRIRNLENHLSSIQINQVLSCIGFPNDWHQSPKIIQ